MLGPTGDRRLDPGHLEVLGDLRTDPGEELLPRGGASGHEVDDLVVHLGVERLEGQVLQLPLDGVHAQPVRQRGVDLQGLLGLGGRRLSGNVFPGAGIVQPVGELDDEHPDVTGHRDDHLADRFGLGRLAPGHLVELGHAVDQLRDLVTEVAAEVLEAVVRVLHRVVQQRRRQRGRGQPEVGKDLGHRQRVGDVVVAAAPGLPLMGSLGDLEGPLQQRDLSLGVVLTQALQDRLKGHVDGGSGCPQPRQAIAQPRLWPGRRRTRESGAGDRDGRQGRVGASDLVGHVRSVVTHDDLSRRPPPGGSQSTRRETTSRPTRASRPLNPPISRTTSTATT